MRYLSPIAGITAADGRYTTGPAGDDPTDYIASNLDDKQPMAEAYSNGGFKGSYFARTTASYCQFRLQFTVLDGTRVIAETIGNGRQPFRVSGGAPAYKEEYNGGIAGGPDGRFVQADPHRS